MNIKLRDYHLAVFHLEKSLAILRKRQNEGGTDKKWEVHDELAQAYEHIDTDKAIHHYNEAIEILAKSFAPPEVGQ